MFTYRCGYLEWSSPTTIGLNAPPDYYYNHPLSGTGVSPDEIACVHLESEWNNVVIDMEPNPVILPITPTPTFFTGTLLHHHFSFFRTNTMAIAVFSVLLINALTLPRELC